MTVLPRLARTVPPRPLLAASLALVVSALAASDGRSQPIAITGGQQINVLPGSSSTADSILVTGRAEDPPTRSTYNLAGSLTLTTSAAVATVSDFGILNVGVTGSLSSAAGYAEVTTDGLLQVSGSVSIADGVFAYDGGQVTLGAAGNITGASLYAAGASAFSRAAGGTYTVGTLSIAESAAVNVTAGDTIAGDVLVDSAATLTLATDLALPSGTLYLNQGGAVSRTSQSIAAATLDVGTDSSLAIAAGDSFSTMLLHGGGQATAAAPLTLAGLTVTGSAAGPVPSSLAAAGTLAITGSGAVTVSDGGLVTTTAGIVGDGGTTISVTGADSRLVTGPATGLDSVTVATGGVLETVAGTLAADTLSLSGPGAFVRTGGGYHVTNLQLAGGTLDFTAADLVAAEIAVTDGAALQLLDDLALSGNLVLDHGGALTRSAETIAVGGLLISDNAALALLAGDSIGALGIATGASVTAPAPLSLTSLAIDGSGALLDLESFGGSAGQIAWALQVAGDQKSILQGYLASGRITTAATPGPVAAFYDLAAHGNVTYVGYITAVPEPSTLVMVAAGLAGVVFARRAARSARRRS